MNKPIKTHADMPSRPSKSQSTPSTGGRKKCSIATPAAQTPKRKA